MSLLLDSSVLIPLAVADHEHHDVVTEWFLTQDDRFATCPITQGAVVRHVVRNGQSARSAATFLAALETMTRHEFWPDDLTFSEVPTSAIRGHRQVTDAYLAELARRRQGRLMTLDQGLAATHADVAELVPKS